MIVRAIAPANQSAGSGGRMLSAGAPQTHGRIDAAVIVRRA
jgi:hypothetical protein